MKILRSYAIFTSRRYRLIMFGILVAVILCNIAIKAFMSEASYELYILVITIAGMAPLYGDLEVFSGLYGGKNSGIASLQSGYAGLDLLKRGIVADRICMLLWLFFVDLSLTVLQASERADACTLVTGTCAVFILLTVSVNINRYFVTSGSVMAASVIEILFVAAAADVLWLVYPVGNLMLCIAALLFAAFAIWLSAVHAAYHFKRSYCDE